MRQQQFVDFVDLIGGLFGGSVRRGQLDEHVARRRLAVQGEPSELGDRLPAHPDGGKGESRNADNRHLVGVACPGDHQLIAHRFAHLVRDIGCDDHGVGVGRLRKLHAFAERDVKGR